MAKVSKSQSFSKATIYFDSDEHMWKVEEVTKDGAQTFDLEQDILAQWADVEGVSITIKKDADLAPRGEE